MMADRTQGGYPSKAELDADNTCTRIRVSFGCAEPYIGVLFGSRKLSEAYRRV